MHREYKRIVPGGDKAILLIHGILGTPNHFGPLLAQIPENISVYNLLLDGHGGSVRDFSHTSKKKWEAQVEAAAEELAKSHKKIYIAAHSLGCLLAIGQAVRDRRIRGLFLLAAPLRLRLRLAMFSTSLKIFFGRVRPDDTRALAAQNCCGITLSKNPLPYFGWIPRFLELFALIRETRKRLPSLAVPCRAYPSAEDEMVSLKSADILAENPWVTVTVLKHSSHYDYSQEDLSLLTREFTKFLF